MPDTIESAVAAAMASGIGAGRTKPAEQAFQMPAGDPAVTAAAIEAAAKAPPSGAASTSLDLAALAPLVGKFMQWLELQNDQGERTKREREEKESITRRAREVTARAQKEARDNELAMQLSCSHLDELGRSAVRGQRTDMTNITFICQNCRALWVNEACPGNLRTVAVMQNIGGPLPPTHIGAVGA